MHPCSMFVLFCAFQANQIPQCRVSKIQIIVLKMFIRNYFTAPTLIETTWPENLLPIQPKVFPNELSHSRLPIDCNSIIKAVQTAIEVETSTLWVLDNGSRFCKPKLIAYNLSRKNEEVCFCKLKSDL